MIKILKILFIAIFSLLPTSPFQAMFDELLIDFNYLPYLNWFLPFDICANMMLAWLDCVLVYYSFVITKKIVLDILVDKIIGSFSGLVGAVGSIKNG